MPDPLPGAPPATKAASIEEAPQRTEMLGMVPSMAKGFVQALVALVAVGLSGGRDFGFLTVALIALAIVMLSLATAFVRWWRTTYRVGADDIRMETGLLSRDARSIPYERIQDVSLAEPLIARLLGLVSVTFETGAGGKDELTLAFVTQAEGERLRQLVRAQQAGETVPVTGGPGDKVVTGPAAQADARTLFAMDLGRVIHFGMFEFSLAVLAVIGVGLQQFDFLLWFDIWDWRFWTGLFEVGTGQLGQLGFMAQVIGGVLAAISLIVVGVATGVIRTVLRDFGFVLEQTERGFRRRRGLLNRSDVVMPVHRVQAAILSTGLVRRQFGWHGLHFVSLANDAKSASHDVAPFAQREEIAPVAAAAHVVLPGPETQWQRPSPRLWIDRFVMLGAVVVATAAVLWLFVPEGLLAVPVALCLLATVQWLGWLRHGWAFVDGQLFVRHGLLAPTIVSTPAAKLQSVEVAQSLLGRWRGYAALRFGLAGGVLNIIGMPPAPAETLRDYVLNEIVQTDFSRVNLPR